MTATLGIEPDSSVSTVYYINTNTKGNNYKSCGQGANQNKFFLYLEKWGTLQKRSLPRLRKTFELYKIIMLRPKQS